MPFRHPVWLACLICGAILTGCQGIGPAVPTPPPVLTSTAIPTDIPEATFPVVTPLPTWTAIPSRTFPPTFTPLPPTITSTPRPPTATANPTADIPLMVTSNGRGAAHLILSEAQLNAVLAHRFDSRPLINYAAAPRVTLRDGSMDMMLLIRSAQSANPQIMTLTLTLEIYSGSLEIRPTRLSPLNVGITTRQVKLGQVLLQEAFADAVKQAVGTTNAVTYNYVSVQTDGVALTVVSSS